MSSQQGIMKTQGGMDMIKRITWPIELWFLVTSEMKWTQCDAQVTGYVGRACSEKKIHLYMHLVIF